MADLRKQAAQIAREEHVPVADFLSLVDHESGWQTAVRSRVGAIGLTQLMPATAKFLGVDPLDALQNLRGGARYLKMQLNEFSNIRLALAAYNAGPGAVRSGAWRRYSETVRYVDNVTAGARKYRGGKTAAQPVSVTPAGGAPSLLDPSPLAVTPHQAVTSDMFGGDPVARQAFEGLGKIAHGWSPGSQLTDLVDASVAATQQPAAATPGIPATPELQPDVPATQRLTAVVKPPERGKIHAAGGYAGSQGVVDSFRKIAGLPVTSAKRDRKLTATGNTSDHFSGNRTAYAEDLSNGYATPQMDAAAQRIAHALGSSWSPKDGPLELTVIRDGYRIQVLYRTHLGGDHFTHIHVGAKRVGT